MTDPITIYHASPKELVVVEVTVNKNVVTTGYQVCILEAAATPLSTDIFWQVPDTAGSDTGIFVGPTTANAFAAGDVARAWYWYTGTPESIIEPASSLVYFT